MMKHGLSAPISAAIALLGAYLLTRSASNEYFFFAGYAVLQLVVLATAWNVLGGYCGYVNFGSGAFFAVGAYASVTFWKGFDAPLGLQIIAAGVSGGILGLGVGYLALRLQGIFFAIATIAVAVVIETAVLHWDFVGGARGISVIRPDSVVGFENYNRFLFFVMAVLAVAALAVSRYVQLSWIGQGLQAVRDDEIAAECMGVPTLRLKLIAATISGALMSVAGSLQPFFMGFIEPTSTFNLNYAILALAMPVIGGTQHWTGPLLGALLLGSMQQLVTVTVSSELNVLIVGVIFIGFVILAPNGILGLLSKLFTRERPNQENPVRAMLTNKRGRTT